MAHAFTPGLKIRRRCRVSTERTLPLPGSVLVQVGSRISSDQVVARTELPGDVEIVKVAQTLGLTPDELPGSMTKKIGDPVQKGEVIARSPGLFGLFRSEFRSPADGAIESISDVTGQIVIRGKPQPVEVHGYIDGLVSEVIPEFGIIAETTATFLQGIFGVGGENWGKLVIAGPPDSPLSEKQVLPEYNDCVIAGGSLMTQGAIRKAMEIGARGLICGGIRDEDLRTIIGYDIGVAITGNEDIPLSLVVTEGFGELPMAHRSYELLMERNGARCSVNGATQIRAGVLRPELIIPYPREVDRSDSADDASEERSGLMDIGTAVRIIREPHFGCIGRVVDLPVELTPIETESKVRVLAVDIHSGKPVILPRANVEIYEG
jgi:hypothetical protein